MIIMIIIIAALIIFLTWTTNRSKNIIKARFYEEYGYDPDIEKLSGAELMHMNDRMNTMGIPKGNRSLKAALEAYQKHSSSYLALNPQQFELIISMPSFEKVDRLYKEQGLTNWGALAWFSAQYIEQILKSMNDDSNRFDVHKEIIELGGSYYELTNKMASMSCLIFDKIPELKLTQVDMTLIKRSALAATKWFNETETPADREAWDIMGLD